MPEVPLPLQFRSFGGACRRDGGSTYAAISESVADDPELLALLEEAPLAQRRPNLLLAAVHYLLLRGIEHPLAAFYDTVRLEEAAANRGDVGPAFRDFCLTQRQPLLALIATRSTQTNEVGRCAILLPAISRIAASYGGAVPLSLLDLGTSAGLNLLFDRYRYRYREDDEGNQGGEGRVLETGDGASGVSLECRVRGPLDQLPTLALPPMADRAGLDLSPIDAASEDEALWLRACLWPDNLTRFSRLQAALELWRTTAERPRLVQGDMVDDLAPVAATVGDDGPLVLFHSWVAAYLTEERQRDLVQAVQQVGLTRPVHHLYAELPFETPGLPTPEGPDGRAGSHAATALVHIGPDGAPPERWGNVHPHGNWLRWFATPTGPTAHRGG
jgi:hypothetical protein